ncbi:MAG: SPOR domain-containing protein [Rhodoferax sp.]|nr:SPOR domain-containing protein [Rhodoferax sp.]
MLILVLLLANGTYFVWSQGLLQAYGLAPASTREPERLAKQVKPDAIGILTEAEIKRVEAQVRARAEPAPNECLRAGPVDEAQIVALRHVLESSLGPTGWQIDTLTVPSRWIIYMGKFANAEGLAKKRGELLAMNLQPQVLNNPSLEIGLSLGGFDTQAEASAALGRLSLRGIRTARVVQETAESLTSHLKLPLVTDAIRAQLGPIQAALGDKPLGKCD